MKIGEKAHLTYCTNIHPGETWDETFHAIRRYAPEVKGLTGAPQMGIGLRLSNEASVGLMNTGLAAFGEWMKGNSCYVFTMNGFPYGDFHGTRVKEHVHEPDWLQPERLAYTKRLAEIHAALISEGEEGGISTSPLSYRIWHGSNEEVMALSVAPLIEMVKFLHEIEDKSGKYIHLDIEPEPDGVMENSEEFIHFYNEFLLKKGGKILRSEGYERPDELIRRYITLCYDVCHFAVEFEDGRNVIDRMESEGITIGKMQISAALRARSDKGNMFDALAAFNESTYLHQAVGRKGGELVKFRDLPELLEARPKLDEVRSHFHVPIFVNSFGELESTSDAISNVLRRWKEKPFTNHLEVETYTWSVLPLGLQQDLSSSIARELNWVLNELSEKP